jgi:hypothetical protein
MDPNRFVDEMRDSYIEVRVLGDKEYFEIK